MRALSLDYRRTDQTWHWTGIILLVLALLGAVWLVHYYRALSAEVAHLETLVSRIERKLHPSHMAVPMTAADVQRRDAELRNAKDAILRLNLPWDLLFQSVEAANSDDIALLGIEPDARKRQVKVSGEAKDFDALLDYIRTLQQSAFLSGVYLEHHQVQDKDPEKPIRFTVGASWTDKR